MKRRGIADAKHRIDYFHSRNISALTLFKFNLEGFSFLNEDIDKLKTFTSLNLANTGLTQVPDGLELLENITSLNLSYNEINLLSESIAKLPNLKQLILNHNKIEEVPEYIGRLSNLTELHLNSNALKSFPECTMIMDSLSTIDLGNNEIAEIPDWFCEITDVQRIEYLNLSHNKLTSLPDDFDNLFGLIVLDLSSNQLKELPEKFGGFLVLQNLNLSNNQLKKLPDSICLVGSVVVVDLDYNELSFLPEEVDQLYSLETLDLSHNNLTQLPEGIYKLNSLTNLNLSYNSLTSIPEPFIYLADLRVLNFSSNKIEDIPSCLPILKSKDRKMTLDYSGNPFLERALQRTASFSKIWKDAPQRLRELLKIYLSGFNIFFFEKTGQQIDFNISNNTDGLGFSFIPSDNNDPDQVRELLNEYFDILIDKMRQAAQTGQAMPQSSSDTAYLFAQAQAFNFANGASYVRNQMEGYVTNLEVYSKVSGRISEMEAAYHDAVNAIVDLSRVLQYEQVQKAHLLGESKANNRELESRRAEALAHVGQPLQISVNQTQQSYIAITQNLVDDFYTLRRLLDEHLKDFDRKEAEKLEEEIEKVTAKPAATPEEKKTLGKRLGRWLEGVSSTFKTGKEIAENGAELFKHWDKLKEFAEGYLSDPSLGERIDAIKHLFTTGRQ